MSSDFNRGLCECGNTIYPVTGKYNVGFLVKNGRDTLAWQWLCKACGKVHHEDAPISNHPIVVEEYINPITRKVTAKKGTYDQTGFTGV